MWVKIQASWNCLSYFQNVCKQTRRRCFSSTTTHISTLLFQLITQTKFSSHMTGRHTRNELEASAIILFALECSLIFFLSNSSAKNPLQTQISQMPCAMISTKILLTRPNEVELFTTTHLLSWQANAHESPLLPLQCIVRILFNTFQGVNSEYWYDSSC